MAAICWLALCADPLAPGVASVAVGLRAPPTSELPADELEAPDDEEAEAEAADEDDDNSWPPACVCMAST